MTLPNLTADDIAQIVPGVTNIGSCCRGGQKIVFPCTIDGRDYALKFLLADPIGATTTDDHTITIDIVDETTARATREVDIMRRCQSPHLIKLGLVALSTTFYKGQNLVYFSEEWVNGTDIKTKLQQVRMLPIEDVVKLGTHINLAIEELWSHRKIHRDIKPGNIMFCNDTERFILLDMGLAFDPVDLSLTRAGFVPGTVPYLSPEQMDLSKKRQLDFRSDLFALGVVMYESATGRHPFYQPGMTSAEVMGNIYMANVNAPSTLRNDIPPALDSIIMRLLSKQPHMRYRTCAQLASAISQVMGSD